MFETSTLAHWTRFKELGRDCTIPIVIEPVLREIDKKKELHNDDNQRGDVSSDLFSDCVYISCDYWDTLPRLIIYTGDEKR